MRLAPGLSGYDPSVTMSRESQPARATRREFTLELGPDPRNVPIARHTLARKARTWGLSPVQTRPVALLASELLAQALIYAVSNLLLTARFDGRTLWVGVSGRMSDEPQRLARVAGPALRRSEAILSAMSRSHGIDRDGMGETLWFELDTARLPWDG